MPHRSAGSPLSCKPITVSGVCYLYDAERFRRMERPLVTQVYVKMWLADSSGLHAGRQAEWSPSEAHVEISGEISLMRLYRGIVRQHTAWRVRYGMEHTLLVPNRTAPLTSVPCRMSTSP